MKKVISLFLSIVMLISVVASVDLSAYAAATSDGYEYTVLDDGTAEITGYTGAATEIDIPSEIGGHQVKSIGNEAFYRCDSLTSVTIPDGVTNIGNNVFNWCESLTSITISDSVTSIGERAFCNCSSLTSITIPNGVTSIGKEALYGCYSLTSIVVNENNESFSSLDGVLFNKDKTLLIQYPIGNENTSYIIPDSVTSIGNGAFLYCSSLTDVYYNGTEEQWKNISIGSDNSELTSANIHYLGEYQYSVLGNGTIEIKGYTGSATELTIPSTIDGYTVTSIGYRAFYNCDSLTSITIPDGVTSIGDFAFSDCYNLTSITIPESVTSIGDLAFNGCFGLTSVTIPDSVTTIGNYAFSVCSSLTSVTIPNSVTSIGNYAFDYCSSLTSVTIPESVTYIGDGAFSYCDSLTSIVVNDNNENYSSLDGVLFNKDKTLLIEYPAGNKNTSYTILDSVTSIGDWAFFSCISLTSITIPDSVISIGEGAFVCCHSLTSIVVNENNENYSSLDGVLFNKDKTLLIRYPENNENTSYTIPDSVTSIGNYAFWGCSSLTNITIPDSVTSIGNYAFCGCSSLTSITIPNGVTSIGNYAFSNCSSLTSVTIPDSVTNIGDYVFNWCNSLTSITIPDGVTSIGNDTFAYCTSLTSITIPNSVTSIGDFAFNSCKSLTSITIPDSVTSIGDFAFGSCTSLTDVYYNGTEEQWKNISIGSNNEYLTNATIHCTDGIINAKENTVVTEVTQPTCTQQGYTKHTCECGYSYIDNYVDALGHNFVNNICTVCGEDLSKYKYTIIDDGIIEITGYTGSATELIIPSTIDGYTVTSIGESAFSDCTSLTSVTIPNSVTIIGNSAFKGCTSLTSVTIPDSVTSIGNYAFSNCAKLTNITIPDSVTNIGSDAFAYCTGLTSITIPNSVTRMGSGAFYGCSSLTNITIPNNLKNIGLYVFSRCTSLTSITIPNSVKIIDSRAFEHCSSLTSVTIPNSVTSIGGRAFEDCTGLVSIDVDSSNKYYSSQDGVLFNKDKTELIQYPLGNTRTAYTIPNSVKSIGMDAFQYCKNLNKLIIPNSVNEISYDAFSQFTALTDVLYLGSESEWNLIPKYGDLFATAPNAKLHFFDSSIVKSATCTDTGIKRYTSATYSETIDEVIPATGHTEVIDNAVAPTCTATGLTEGSHCSVCNTVITEQTIVPATGHIYTSEITKEATCTATGVKTFTCTACGDSYTEEIDMIPHTPVTDAAVAPTCTATGLTEGSHCSVCNTVITEQTVVPLTGHNWVFSKAVPAICVEGGYNLYKCQNDKCTESYKEYTSPAIDHSYAQTEYVVPTCTEEGYTTYTCTICCDSYTVAIAKTSHTPATDAAVAPTCTATGLTEGSHCSVCNTVITEQTVVPATGHTEVIDNAVVPTCTATGLTQGKHCSVCNTVITEQTVVPATGHNFANDTCTVCGEANKANYKYTILDDGTIEIIGYTGSATELSIPSTIDGYTVTSIGESAFSDCDSLTSITIPDSVTSIGDFAFGDCSSLTSITIPDSVTNIGNNGVFANCYRLDRINVDSNNKNYLSEDGILFNKSKTELVCYPAGKSTSSYTIPNSVTSIGNYAFWGCSSLTNITIPDSVTSIGNYAFCGCSSLTNITIPDSVTSIGNSAFSNCSSLTSVTIPDSVTSIGSHAFSACKNLTSITIPDSVTSIGDYAFYCCFGLTSITIPDSVTSIGDYAFFRCDSLKDVYYSGTIEQWNNIEIGEYYNEYLTNATIHCTDGIINAKENTVVTEVTQPTCTQQGYTTYTCECGYSCIGDYVPATGHTEVIDNAVAPTCTATGLTEGSHCSVCNTVITEQTIVPATGHTYNSEITKEATCTATGVKTFTCTACGDSYTEEIDMIPHTPVTDAAVAPTCTATGLTEGSHCSVCETIIVAQEEIPVAGHTYEITDSKNATCIDGGYNKYKCNICGYEYTENLVATGHKYVEKVVASTCTEQGYTEYVCQNCGNSYRDNYTELAEHSYGDFTVTQYPSCSKLGTKMRVCNNCSAYEVKYLDKLPHTEIKVSAVPATCINTGLTEGTKCDVCGEVIKAQEVVPYADHTYSVVAEKSRESTCTEQGMNYYRCNACGTSYTSTLALKSHNYEVIESTDSTPNTRGYDLYKCKNCTDQYKSYKNYTSDNDALVAALLMVSIFKETDFSEMSYEKFKSIYDSCQTLVKSDASQDEIDAAITSILESVYSLEAYADVDVFSKVGEIKISFNDNEYTDTSYSVLYGTEMTLTASDVDGYVFSGWFDTKSKRTVSNEKTYTFIVTANTTLEAIYNENSSASLIFANESGWVQETITKTVTEWNEIEDISTIAPEVPYSHGAISGSWKYNNDEVLSTLRAGNDVTITAEYVREEEPEHEKPSDIGIPNLSMCYEYSHSHDYGSFIMYANIPVGTKVNSVGIAVKRDHHEKFDPTKTLLTLNKDCEVSYFNALFYEDVYVLNAPMRNLNYAAVGFVTYFENGELKTVYSNQVNVVKKQWVK